MDVTDVSVCSNFEGKLSDVVLGFDSVEPYQVKLSNPSEFDSDFVGSYS